jgi:hypothetical protein
MLFKTPPTAGNTGLAQRVEQCLASRHAAFRFQILAVSGCAFIAAQLA